LQVVRATDKLTAAAKENTRSTGIHHKLVTYLHDQLWLARLKVYRNGRVSFYINCYKDLH